MSTDDSESVTSESSTSTESDTDDVSENASVRSLAFRVKPGKTTATIKSKKSKKRVRFKPGDSLVLVYWIPNREMLGLKSGSDDSDDSGEETDDEDDDDEDDVDDDEDDDDEDDDDDDDDEDDDDDDSDGERKAKVKSKKDKPFARLIAVKQINNRRRSLPDLRNNIRKTPERPKSATTVDVNLQLQKSKKRNKKFVKKDRKERGKNSKKEVVANLPVISVNNRKLPKKNKLNAIKPDIEKPNRHRRSRARLLEIRATVESQNRQGVQMSAPKMTYKNDVRTSIPDVNNSLTGTSKPLTNRTRLQPTSFRITKPDRPNSGVSHSTTELPVEKPRSVAHVVSASYDSLTSVLPSSYVQLTSALQKHGIVEKESITRLDPDNMNAASKRNYGWQIANGTISSQSLRTPSILPFLDSLQNSISDNNTIKLPT
ncbi:putative uncharacterized protein DDB_G0270496 [Mya arenaria]|uniref:putative uncharacterized protein DDB_G0270496 n=1 Tax=Mya arenaria TaxID=6604 RepID=UPI0022E6F40F|nr:putative uncharacterized protein DDB_G0270496 [Mya arenaria]